MYESQRMRQKWFSVLGDEPEQTEEEQDSIKVSYTGIVPSIKNALTLRSQQLHYMSVPCYSPVCKLICISILTSNLRLFRNKKTSKIYYKN